MQISIIKLKGVDHSLAGPINIVEEDYISSNGQRMIKMYNDIFGLLGFGEDTESTRDCFREEIDLIINSYLFDPTYIHDKPMLGKCLILRNNIVRHVYGEVK